MVFGWTEMCEDYTGAQAVVNDVGVQGGGVQGTGASFLLLPVPGQTRPHSRSDDG
jgi:hypothetical protein